MFEVIAITILKIVFMYGAMQEGEIFGPDSKILPIRRWLEWLTSRLSPDWQHYARKPLFDCLFCMSSVWGLFFLWCPMPLWLEIILSIAAVNYLLSAQIGFLHEGKDASEAIEKRISDLENDMWPLGK